MTVSCNIVTCTKGILKIGRFIQTFKDETHKYAQTASVSVHYVHNNRQQVQTARVALNVNRQTALRFRYYRNFPSLSDFAFLILGPLFSDEMPDEFALCHLKGNVA
jgi:hypothetical protein